MVACVRDPVDVHLSAIQLDGRKIVIIDGNPTIIVTSSFESSGPDLIQISAGQLVRAIRQIFCAHFSRIWQNCRRFRMAALSFGRAIEGARNTCANKRTPTNLIRSHTRLSAKIRKYLLRCLSADVRSIAHNSANIAIDANATRNLYKTADWPRQPIYNTFSFLREKSKSVVP